ncbi:YdeI/OmpD-associated family protein [Xinfangfangia sp. CPCC 101601]|uniref:YdeI/OmpD-associated family protein n=1 Tax=Pseudogemmobacter lacusdianii TaxID=3069608 RepID=A0ABU0VWP3_9RHOB|nr:YdeI/OmpD-associated family protein [Xinfangfangia sp. CPCC 101601]MDQ2065340.1 YdeI/OmpD-associated family protein [Xinfangfangia sp. CPCC 101601]
MITEIEDYFSKGCGRCARFASPDCATQIWAEGLAALRALCLRAGLVEELRWGHPCYRAAGRNVAIIGALRGGFRLSFFDAALMTDPEGLLEKQGPNAAHADGLHFTSAAQVAAREEVILRYLAEAKHYAEAGIKSAKQEVELELPPELVAAMDDDPELAEAFHRLTPGRQKSHVLMISGSKVAATRINRIAKLKPKILAGKGANEY